MQTTALLFQTPVKELDKMCDYSLHGVATRPAKVGDTLVSTRFPGTLTRGFSEPGKPSTAVCLQPGTELAFEQDVQEQFTLLQGLAYLVFRTPAWTIPHKVGRFRQINLHVPAAHHDAIEFPDGKLVLLTRLRVGQRATVLQLPVQADSTPPTGKAAERAGAGTEA